MDYRRRENTIRYKKQLMREKQKMKRSVCKFSTALIVTSIMAAFIVPAEYAARSYFAFGGEWLFLCVVFAAVYAISYR